MSETEYNEAKHREAELLAPVGNLDGIGDKIQERLVEADISSVQRLAAATVDTLVKIPGIGEKTAETLIEKAQEYVKQLETEYDRKRNLQKQREAERAAREEKLTAEDVFDDDEDYVTEQDDVPLAQAPDFGDLLEDDGSEDEAESEETAPSDEDQDEPKNTADDEDEERE